MHGDGVGHQGAADQADDAENDIVGDGQKLGQVVSNLESGQTGEQGGGRTGGHAADGYAAQAQQGDSDAASGTEPDSTPAPTTDRGSDIPDTPFTGESASPSPSPDSGQESGEGSSSSESGGGDGDGGSSASAPDGPYYSSG